MKKRFAKKRMTSQRVQKAWDTVCEYLDENKDNATHTLFISSVSGEWGHITVTSSNANLLVSTKRYL